jgi:hypothetical protein
MSESKMVEIGWDGACLEERKELWSMRLDEDDRRRLAADYRNRQPQHAKRVRTRLSSFIHDSDRAVGLAHIANLVDTTAPEAEITQSLLFVLEAIGRVVPQNGQGDRIQVLRDRDGDGATELGFHCDTCDLLVLLCLQPAVLGGGFTRLACARRVQDILEQERPDAVAALRRNWTFDRTGRAGPQVIVSPILFTQADGTVGCYYQTRTVRASAQEGGRPLTEEQLSALSVLDEVLTRPDVGFNLLMAAGDLLIIRNSRVLHGRSSYTDQPGPKSRRMLRIWMSTEDR